MRQHFLTKETATKNLEQRRTKALENYKEWGWKLILDNSYVYPQYKWLKRKKYGSYTTIREIVWYANLVLFSDKLMNELKQNK